MLQILDPSGRVVGDLPDLTDEDFVEIYRLMALSRQFDRRAMLLQRKGRLGTYPPLEGQEASQIGSAYAAASGDWFYPGYREHGVQLARGLPVEAILSFWSGRPNRRWDIGRHRMHINTIPIATQIPHAVGHAYAARMAGDDAAVVTYFGDGATSEGDFHAGMNFAGVWNAPVVFICCNNRWAISVPLSQQTAAPSLAAKAEGYGMPGVQVDGMDALAVFSAVRRALERAREGGGPTFVEALTYRYGPHATADDPSLYRTEEEVRAWREKDPLDRFRRFLASRRLWSDELHEGPTAEMNRMVDEAAEAVEAQVHTRDGAVRHVYSRLPESLARQLHTAQRREGEEPSVFEPGEMWRPGLDRTPTGETGETAHWTMAEAVNDALHQAMERFPEAIVLGEDVGVAGGVFRITEGLQRKFGAERVIDTPLCESGIVGTAVGMAAAGARPIAEIQFDGFVYPAFDQIVSHLARMRFRTRGNVEMPVVVRWPNGAGIGAHEFHCDSPESFFAHAPGLVVIVPSTPADAKGLLTAAIESPDPVLFLEPKVLYRSGREPVPVDHYALPIGRARVRRTGDDATIVTYGGSVPTALAAAGELAAEGVECEVIDLRTLKPWDRETVLESVERTARLILVQEPPRTAGVAAEISATVAEEGLFFLDAPIVRITGFDAPWPQFATERHALITPARITSAVKETLL